MKYISVKQASQKWGISERRVRILCSENRIDGVTKSSWAWNIPSNAPKPSDGRIIRHIKNFDMRVNSINLNDLIEKVDKFNKIIDSQEKYLEFFNDSVDRFLLMALSQENIEAESILKILNKEIDSSLSFESNMLVLNSKAIIIDFFRQTGFGPILASESKTDPFLSDRILRKINNNLYRGYQDYKVSKYREGMVINPSSFDEKTYNVSMQIETLIFQYEREWSSLNPLVKASFMFAQLLRIKPFGEHHFLFASLIFAAILLDSNYPLSIIPYDLVPELKANLTLTLKRGNYSPLINMFKTSLLGELDRLIDLQ